jgi:hypothetical protein
MRVLQYSTGCDLRETAVVNIKAKGKHDHREQLTEGVVVAAKPNQGCSDGNTTLSLVGFSTVKAGPRR